MKDLSCPGGMAICCLIFLANPARAEPDLAGFHSRPQLESSDHLLPPETARSNPDAPAFLGGGHNWPLLIARAEQKQRFRQDLKGLQLEIKELQRLLVLFRQEGGLFSKTSIPANFLTGNERDELFVIWKRLVSSLTRVDGIVRIYSSSSWSPQQLSPEVDFEGRLLSNIARAVKLTYGMMVLDIVKKSERLPIMLDEGKPQAGLSPGSFTRLRRLVSHKADLGNLIRFQRFETSSIERYYNKPNTHFVDEEKWMLGYWTKSQSRVGNIATGSNALGSTLSTTLAMPFEQAFGSVQRPVLEQAAIFLAGIKLKRPNSHLISRAQIEKAVPQLEPGDIILEKTNWYLCNFFIEGFWGHSILYIGSHSEAAEYFDEPEINDYFRSLGATSFSDYVSRRYPLASRVWQQKHPGDNGEIRVIEGDGVRQTVVLNSVEDSFAGDFIAALRPRRLSKLDKAKAVVDALSYWSTKYDFGFDLRTDSALMCTELLAKAYASNDTKKGLRFQVRKIQSGYMIYPNDIAELYAQERNSNQRQFDFVFFLQGLEGDKRAFFSSESAFASSRFWKTTF